MRYLLLALLAAEAVFWVPYLRNCARRGFRLFDYIVLAYNSVVILAILIALAK